MDTELIAHKTQVRRLPRGEFYPASIELVGEDSPTVSIEGTVEQLRKLATDILMTLSTDKELESYRLSFPISADKITAGTINPENLIKQEADDSLTPEEFEKVLEERRDAFYEMLLNSQISGTDWTQHGTT